MTTSRLPCECLACVHRGGESYYSRPEVRGVDCSERDRLEKAVAQATLEWTVLEQTPLPDV
jgi:hypothetical protein